MTLLASALLGSQQPRLHSVPLGSGSQGDDAVELAAIAGLILDPWQELVLRDALREAANGRWSAFEVGLVVGRQNGKGAVLEALELAHLFLFGAGLILHSAHEFKTAADAYRRIKQLIQGSPDLNAQVLKYSNAHGSEGIELRDGRQLRFVARTGGSGRGFSADLVVLDEAYNLPEHAMAALLPTMSARLNPQLWYTSSAVNAEQHPHGLVLARLRRRGMAGDDPSLAYFEWSVDEDVYAENPRALSADPDAWAQANPGLGIRITAEHIERERRSMFPKTFGVERLSVGDWPEEAPDDNGSIIDSDVWAALTDPDAADHPLMPVAIAVDVAPDRSSGSIAVAARRPDGRVHVEVAHNNRGVGWIVDEIAGVGSRPGMIATSKPCALVVDPGGPAGSLIAAIEARGVKVDVITAREYAQACGQFFDLATEGGLTHFNQAQLNNALDAASTRPLGEAWAWDRKKITADLSPLVAVTLALQGLTTHENDHPDSVYEGRGLVVL